MHTKCLFSPHLLNCAVLILSVFIQILFHNSNQVFTTVTRFATLFWPEIPGNPLPKFREATLGKVKTSLLKLTFGRGATPTVNAGLSRIKSLLLHDCFYPVCKKNNSSLHLALSKVNIAIYTRKWIKWLELK